MVHRPPVRAGRRCPATRLIRECHDSATGGHLGRDKTVDQMKRRFFWHGMDDEGGGVRHHLRRMPEEQAQPAPHARPAHADPVAAQRRGHTWTMDLITQLPKSRKGNDAIVVWVCKLTKLRHYAACKTAIDAPALARLFLDSVVRLHGMPERIISDRDPRFTAHFWRAFWATLGSTLDMSTAYHPQSDGQTENANKTLEIMLRSVIDFAQDDWDEHLCRRRARLQQLEERHDGVHAVLPVLRTRSAPAAGLGTGTAYESRE